MDTSEAGSPIHDVSVPAAAQDVPPRRRSRMPESHASSDSLERPLNKLGFGELNMLMTRTPRLHRLSEPCYMHASSTHNSDIVQNYSWSRFAAESMVSERVDAGDRKESENIAETISPPQVLQASQEPQPSHQMPSAAESGTSAGNQNYSLQEETATRPSLMTAGEQSYFILLVILFAMILFLYNTYTTQKELQAQFKVLYRLATEDERSVTQSTEVLNWMGARPQQSHIRSYRRRSIPQPLMTLIRTLFMGLIAIIQCFARALIPAIKSTFRLFFYYSFKVFLVISVPIVTTLFIALSVASKYGIGPQSILPPIWFLVSNTMHRLVARFLGGSAPLHDRGNGEPTQSQTLSLLHENCNVGRQTASQTVLKPESRCSKLPLGDTEEACAIKRPSPNAASNSAAARKVVKNESTITEDSDCHSLKPTSEPKLTQKVPNSSSNLPSSAKKHILLRKRGDSLNDAIGNPIGARHWNSNRPYISALNEVIGHAPGREEGTSMFPFVAPPMNTNRQYKVSEEVKSSNILQGILQLSEVKTDRGSTDGAFSAKIVSENLLCKYPPPLLEQRDSSEHMAAENCLPAASSVNHDSGPPSTRSEHTVGLASHKSLLCYEVSDNTTTGTKLHSVPGMRSTSARSSHTNDSNAVPVGQVEPCNLATRCSPSASAEHDELPSSPEVMRAPLIRLKRELEESESNGCLTNHRKAASKSSSTRHSRLSRR